MNFEDIPNMPLGVWRFLPYNFQTLQVAAPVYKVRTDQVTGPSDLMNLITNNKLIWDSKVLLHNETPNTLWKEIGIGEKGEILKDLGKNKTNVMDVIIFIVKIDDDRISENWKEKDGCELCGNWQVTIGYSMVVD